ncbi:MAG: RNA-binding S4 domain-containing protein [Acidimicrobiales bacterium]
MTAGPGGGAHGAGGAVRVDTWLWSVRLFRSRTLATEACGAGRVLVNDRAAKPSTKVSVGDTVTARHGPRTMIVVVERLIEKRVSARLAAECYQDLSPPPPDRSVAPPVAVRDRGAGRPTKRDRRRIEQFRGSG